MTFFFKQNSRSDLQLDYKLEQEKKRSDGKHIILGGDRRAPREDLSTRRALDIGLKERRKEDTDWTVGRRAAAAMITRQKESRTPVKLNLIKGEA